MNIQVNAATRLAATKLIAGRETGEGAGALFYAEDTGNVLICKRSNTGDAAGQWCCLGGGVDSTDTSFEHTVRREAFEEGGFPMDAECKLYHMHAGRVAPDFVFHNYLAIVPKQFEPVLNSEHTDYKWLPYSELLTHENMHEGMMRALSSDLALHTLKKRCGIDV
jgi:8-oxo-dGTP pyrophosphatase MutT (NUDIX family)